MSNKLGYALLGGAIGAAAAMLLSPKTGEENRAIVAEKVNALWGDAQNLGANAGESAQQAYQKVAGQAQEVAGKASARVQEVASNLKPSSEGTDELREKIEAARQRIANQVAKNAGETSDAAAETIEAAVEKVEDVKRRGAWDELGMDPSVMARIEQATGFDDWGDPFLHAIYWAAQGDLRAVYEQSVRLYKKNHP